MPIYRLEAFRDVEEAIAMVSARFADLAKADPELALDISAADPDDLRVWHAAGLMLAIRAKTGARDAVVGLLAVAPGTVEWIEGNEVNEEVVASNYNGHGYAASAQRAWAALPNSHPDGLMIGTIDRLNLPSRRSAERAGRSAVLDYAFVELPKR